jgi:pimeloyl-ACP methyl ester carboxylesterase
MGDPIVVNGHSGGTNAAVYGLSSMDVLDKTVGLIGINPPGLSKDIVSPSNIEIMRRISQEFKDGLGLSRLVRRDILMATGGIALNGLKMATSRKLFDEGREILGTSLASDFMEIDQSSNVAVSLVIGGRDAVCPPGNIADALEGLGYSGQLKIFANRGHSDTLIAADSVAYIACENLRLLSQDMSLAA